MAQPSLSNIQLALTDTPDAEPAMSALAPAHRTCGIFIHFFSSPPSRTRYIAVLHTVSPNSMSLGYFDVNEIRFATGHTSFLTGTANSSKASKLRSFESEGQGMPQVRH